jgi:GNAT superfamily N-acetyltransferase
MIKANYSDRELIVDILSQSFDDNQSVNYIIRQDSRRKERIRRLIEYSFDVCYWYGKVYLSDDKNGCVLIVLPEKKKTSLRSIWLDVKLMIHCLGFSNIMKALSREAKIKKLQSDVPMYYLWFIGVTCDQQGKGIGGTLMNEVIKESESDGKIICLETSTLLNIPWYQKFGFTIYNELDLGYKMFFLKRDVRK